jgi:hypothetical protein
MSIIIIPLQKPICCKTEDILITHGTLFFSFYFQNPPKPPKPPKTKIKSLANKLHTLSNTTKSAAFYGNEHKSIQSRRYRSAATCKILPSPIMTKQCKRWGWKYFAYAGGRLWWLWRLWRLCIHALAPLHPCSGPSASMLCPLVPAPWLLAPAPWLHPLYICSGWSSNINYKIIIL